MSLKRWAAAKWGARRLRAFRRAHEAPEAMQQRTLRRLLHEGASTAFGRDHKLGRITGHEGFRDHVPVRDYEAARAYFDRIYHGESDVCWPGKPLYLAKTSGTTSGAKYIPITGDSIRRQVAAARDALLTYIAKGGNPAFLDGRMMFLSGSPVLETNPYGMSVGRLSGIVNHFVPAYLRRNQVPTFETNCIEDWDAKVESILDEITGQDLRLISGIPPWVQMLFERLEARTGKLPLEQWPNLSLFVQGGVDFSPYAPIFERYFQGKVDILETFPASEGFFAFQDGRETRGMLLNLQGGIYFEFIPLEDSHSPSPRRLHIGEVEQDVDYALVVTTNAGLWAYEIGDIVRFVSLKPHRLKVTGRTKHFLSAFGEHLIAEEVNQAMIAAAEKHGARVKEFTVAPFISEVEGESYHEWLIEFEAGPDDDREFARTLDEAVRKQNVYYEDLRAGGMLKAAVISPLKAGATRAYMHSQGKLGGQNKFPRLCNHREIADFLHKESWISA